MFRQRGCRLSCGLLSIPNARRSTLSMKKPCWQGVFPAVTTQMRKDGSLDLDATARHAHQLVRSGVTGLIFLGSDRKSTRLNSSHLVISYAVFCLKTNKQ